MAQNRSHPHDLTVRRACMPELLLVPDVALALSLSHSAARRAILRGDCGPYLRLGRRLAVLRESFLAALEARQVSPSHRATLQLVCADAPSRAPGRTDARDNQDEDE
jgi:hypothetical protein